MLFKEWLTFEDKNDRTHLCFLPMQLLPQTVSLFSVGFPSDNYSSPLILPHPWLCSMFITRCYLCPRSALKGNAGRNITKRVFLCVITTIVTLMEGLSAWSPRAAADWCALHTFPQVCRVDSSVQLTLDRCAVSALSPKGWSHHPQTATQEGDHMAVVMRVEACRDKEAVWSLISLLLDMSFDVCLVLRGSVCLILLRYIFITIWPDRDVQNMPWFTNSAGI